MWTMHFLTKRGPSSESNRSGRSGRFRDEASRERRRPSNLHNPYLRKKEKKERRENLIQGSSIGSADTGCLACRRWANCPWRGDPRTWSLGRIDPCYFLGDISLALSISRFTEAQAQQGAELIGFITHALVLRRGHLTTQMNDKKLHQQTSLVIPDSFHCSASFLCCASFLVLPLC